VIAFYIWKRYNSESAETYSKEEKLNDFNELFFVKPMRLDTSKAFLMILVMSCPGIQDKWVPLKTSQRGTNYDIIKETMGGKKECSIRFSTKRNG
jgi:hypothetical protein